MKEKINQKEEQRKKAIALYKNKWNVKEICLALKCSRNWFYKWQKRYQSKQAKWYEEQSRSPKKVHNRRSKETEEKIIKTRKVLIENPYMQYGPQAIYYYLKEKGENPPPIWTITRVLRENKLSKPNRKHPYIPKGKKYPYEYNRCHQMDYVGPRYLSNKEKYYFNNILCCDTHYSQARIYSNQNSVNACESLLEFWSEIGIPDYLQMDNDISFWGSIKEPTAIGKVIRLCLANKVIPVFIPQREPWRNGKIERFNDTMQQAILCSAKYNDLKELQKATYNFCKIHNESHHYSTQSGMTPIKRIAYLQNSNIRVEKNVVDPKKNQKPSSGEIHIIRFIRTDLNFYIFGINYKLPTEADHEYILGKIDVNKNLLKIYNGQKMIAEYEFKIR